VPLPDTSLGRFELVYKLTQAAWAMNDKPWPSYSRAEMPIRWVKRSQDDDAG